MNIVHFNFRLFTNIKHIFDNITQILRFDFLQNQQTSDKNLFSTQYNIGLKLEAEPASNFVFWQTIIYNSRMLWAYVRKQFTNIQSRKLLEFFIHSTFTFTTWHLSNWNPNSLRKHQLRSYKPPHPTNSRRLIIQVDAPIPTELEHSEDRQSEALAFRRCGLHR